MKNVFMRKTAALLATVMVLSMLMPMMAFADFGTITNKSNQTVTGSIYVTSGVYAEDGFLNDDDTVTINVYKSDGTAVGAVYATYASMSNGSYYYDFNNASLSGFNLSSSDYPLSLSYYNPVDSTYVTSGAIAYQNTSGGGGIYIPPATGSDISVSSNGSVDANALANALEADGNVMLSLTGDFVLLPASALTEDGIVTIEKADGTSYELPLSVLDLEALADSVGVELDDLTIRVDIETLTGDDATAVVNAVNLIGGKSLSDAIEFKVTATGNGKTVEVNNFGNTYVNRMIPLTEESDTAVGVLYDPATGEFSFVPSTFSTENGKTVATLKRNGNSIYTVIEVDAKSFEDLAGHWAQSEVETLSSKLIVEGTGADMYEPERNITRAEFATMIVRSLGLTAEGTSEFSDVPSGEWYTAAVATAADAGIVKGYEDGSFHPNAMISRKELAAMVVRAMAFAGEETTLTAAEVDAALASFIDAGTLDWAKDEVAAAVSAGIVKGQTSTLVAGDFNATRAEAATMILRFLTKVDFIN
ncbi:S-layer homology domain-containing protein [Paenibacillus sp. HB172176]|uniref:S-layer homology domain-containing protein n=1 Tax=Paenibacillus sp. HB172176 TaxID=2493690 RepID=UPI00143ABCB3|nr:S-layer homology domain-containing protein [Paenibacillus sp. HB172176]